MNVTPACSLSTPRVARRGELQAPIELLRAWETRNQQAERTLHKILKLANQHYSQPGACQEWFETSLDLLDEITKLMGLKLLS